MGASRKQAGLVLLPMVSLNLADAIGTDEETATGNSIAVGGRGMEVDGRVGGENESLKPEGFVEVDDMVLLYGSERMDRPRKTSVSSADFDKPTRVCRLKDARCVIEIAKGRWGDGAREVSDQARVRVSDGIIVRAKGDNLVRRKRRLCAKKPKVSLAELGRHVL